MNKNMRRQLLKDVVHRASLSELGEYATQIANSPALAGTVGAGVGAIGGAALGKKNRGRNALIGAGIGGGAGAAAATDTVQTAVGNGLKVLVQLVRGVSGTPEELSVAQLQVQQNADTGSGPNRPGGGLGSIPRRPGEGTGSVTDRI